MKTIGIYVHIPFCASKCYYCDFYSAVCDKTTQQNYVKSLICEIEANKQKFKNCSINTIFIGGGTPSTLTPGLIPLIVNTIKQNYNMLSNAEITIEANPNSINYVSALEWIECGINRVSVGLQSSSDKLLKLLNRIHTFADYKTAMENLTKAGFKNINTDCLLGLPHQRASNVKHTISNAAAFSTHISCYTLILEENTPLSTMVKNGEIKLPKESKTLSLLSYAKKLLEKSGFSQYEVSNFCLNGYECKHNYNTWKLGEYVGFGAAAHSFVGGVRYNNIANIEKYITNINNSLSVVEEEHTCTKEELIEEYIMLGLRLADGINLEHLKVKFGVDLLKEKKNEIKQLLDLELIEIKNNHLTAQKGFNVLNQIILMLV